MTILCENKKYIVEYEYESVYLREKTNSSYVCIGQFYGDPFDAILDKNNQFCVMCGCGIIVYYLNKPFVEYDYNKKSKQWRKFFCKEELYFTKLYQLGDNEIMAIEESGKKILIKV